MIRFAKIIPLCLAILAIPELAWAGDFYKLYPSWIEFIYHLLLLAFIAASLYTSYSIYKTMQGGKLGLPWLLVMISLIAVFLRTILGFLTVLEVAYFKAIVFAILDLIFFILLMAGLLLYKENLE
jgi:hypothetical protein